MSDTLFDISQYQSQGHTSYSPDWRDATGTDPAWEQPSLEPDLGTNPEGAEADAPNGWQSEAEFSLTLQSGQTVEVTFVPCLVGKRRMHEFSFTGPVSSTGFKSHFVLAAEAEQFPHPRDYAQAYAQELVDQHESKTETPSKKRSPSTKAVPVPPSPTVAHDDSTPDPAMTEDKTTELKHTPVEVVEELSPEEQADRLWLELKVERAFYESGKALVELRSRRLYRSTHKSFDQYCRDRFGFQRRHCYRLIDAVAVVENLCPNGTHQKLETNGTQPLPTNERQVRELIGLEPDEQRHVWQQAVSRAGGKVPSSRVVKEIVEGLKKRDPTPPQIPFRKGDVVLIRGLGNPELKRYDGHWALVLAINEYSITIGLNAKDIPVKPKFLEPVEPKYWADIKAVNERITRLKQYELDPMESAGIEVLRRRTCFTPKQITLLERMENDYGVI